MRRPSSVVSLVLGVMVGTAGGYWYARLPASTSDPTITGSSVASAAERTVAAAADTVALEGAAAAEAAEAAEAVLEDAAAAEVAATAAAEAAVSGLDLSRSASEPLVCKGRNANLVNAVRRGL
jgi:hypothetical protein